jgi:hypothetical protein
MSFWSSKSTSAMHGFHFESPGREIQRKYVTESYCRARLNGILCVGVLASFVLCGAIAKGSPVGNDAFQNALHVGMTRAQVIRAARWDGGNPESAFCGPAPNDSISEPPLPLVMHVCFLDGYYNPGWIQIAYTLRFSNTGRIVSWSSEKEQDEP